MSKELIRSLNVIVENYPELKADTLYSKMMDDIQEQNENVGAAISIFNRNVEVFNNQIEVFPNNLINTMTLSKKQFVLFAIIWLQTILTTNLTFSLNKKWPFNREIDLFYSQLHLVVELRRRIKENSPLIFRAICVFKLVFLFKNSSYYSPYLAANCFSPLHCPAALLAIVQDF